MKCSLSMRLIIKCVFHANLRFDFFFSPRCAAERNKNDEEKCHFRGTIAWRACYCNILQKTTQQFHLTPDPERLGLELSDRALKALLSKLWHLWKFWYLRGPCQSLTIAENLLGNVQMNDDSIYAKLHLCKHDETPRDWVSLESCSFYSVLLLQ